MRKKNLFADCMTGSFGGHSSENPRTNHPSTHTTAGDRSACEKRHTFCQKSPIFHRKSAMLYQESPIFCHKSPVFDEQSVLVSHFN